MKNRFLQLVIISLKFSCYIFIIQMIFMTSITASDASAQLKSVKEVYIMAKFNNTSIAEVFKGIEAQTNFKFHYFQKDLKKGLKVDFEYDQITVADILYKMSAIANIKFRQLNSNIAVSKIISPFDKTLAVIEAISISGKVTDETGEGLAGVSVIIKNTTQGTITDVEGYYQLEVSEESTLVFSFIGYKTQEIQIGNNTTLDVLMSVDAQTLSEIVVTAFGTSTRDAFTGSADVISSEDLELRTVTSPIAAIEGTATGVQIIAASGQPGSSPGIIIRGVGTLNGSSSPLFIVDGVQFEGGLTTLNQDDIESMTVLKDAASTALYGARAANGVVIITTKKGKMGSPIKINVSSQYGVVSNGIGNFEAVSPGDYYELMWEAYKNALSNDSDVTDPVAEASATIFNRLGYNPFNVANDQIIGTNGQLNPNASVKYKGLDWYDVLERKGSRANHSISISGGGDDHSLFFSTSYLEEKGYVIESDFDRLTTRLNADFNAKDWLTVGGSVNLTFSESHGPTGAGTGSIVNPFAFAKNMGSIYPVYIVDNDGNYALDAAGDRQFDYGEGHSEFGIQSRPESPGRHALAEAIFNEELDRSNSYGVRFYAEFKILEGLTTKISYGQDLQGYINKSYENNIVGDGAPTGRYGETRFLRVVKNFSQVLNFDRTLMNVHNINVTLGHENFDRNYSENNALANTQTAEGIFEFANFSVPSSLGGYTSDKNIEGYFARLNYNFDDKYYLSASVRRDGSSVFQKDSRWGIFYSVGASWRIDQEEFMNSVSFIDRLKLRASFGQVGNDNLGDFYLSQPRYSLTSNAGAPAIFWSDLGNNALEWETAESYDVALEFSVLDNLIDGSVEYYKKNSTELLYNVPIALSNGLNEIPQNIGTMFNSGIEIGLTGHIIKTNDFNWDLTVQASTLKNKITDIPSPFVSGSKRWAEGRSRYDFYIYQSAGVDPATGDALYYMYENDEVTGDRIPVLDTVGMHQTTNDWDDAGRAYAEESSIPDLIGSVQNSLSYKGISLGFMFTFSQGGKILDNGYSAMMHEGEYGASLHVDALNAWKAPGDITSVPRLENGNSDQVQTQSTRFLTDASYLALRNVNLSYTFNDVITDKIGVDNLRVFVSGENLFIKTERKGLNPQYSLAGTSTGRDYNPSRIISFGINVSL